MRISKLSDESNIFDDPFPYKISYSIYIQLLNTNCKFSIYNPINYLPINIDLKFCISCSYYFDTFVLKHF